MVQDTFIKIGHNFKENKDIKKVIICGALTRLEDVA